MIETEHLERVCVVIPVLNNWRLTARCLDALYEYTDPRLLAEVIVVDNGSHDATPRKLLQRPNVTTLHFPENRGFGPASNAGARMSKAPYILFLNNDAFAHAGAVAALLGTMRDPGVGIAGARLLYADGSLQHAGVVLHTGPEFTPLHWHLPGDLPDAQVPRDYPAVTGAAMLVRREVFETLNGFDDAFQTGYEDLDFCLRAWQRGIRVRYEPAAVLTHLEGSTPGREDHEAHNREIMFARWKPLLQRLPQLSRPEAPCLALTGNLGEDSVTAYVARIFFHHIAGYGFPVRWMTQAAPPAPIVGELSRILQDRRDLAILGHWLEVTPLGGPTANQVIFAAPVTAQEARACVRPGAPVYYALTRHAQRLLLEAGADSRTVQYLGIGAETVSWTPSATPAFRDVAGAAVLAYVGELTSDDAIAAYIEAAVRADVDNLIFLSDLPAAALKSRVLHVAQPFGTARTKIVMTSTSGTFNSLPPGALVRAVALLVWEPVDRLGWVIQSAMSTATYIVARNGPLIDEFVDDSCAAIVTDVASMARAIRTAIENPQAVKALRDQAAFEIRRRSTIWLSARHGAALLRSVAFGYDNGAQAMMTARAAADVRAFSYDDPP